MSKKTKRNAQDTTLRNVRAAKKRDSEFSEHLNRLEDAIAELEWRLDALQDQIDSVNNEDK